MANGVRDNESDKFVNNKECWNGKKTASQLTIDSEATEVFFSTFYFSISIYLI